MNRLVIVFLTLSFFTIDCIAQEVENIKIDKVFLDNTDTTKSRYTILYPQKRPWKGYIFLVPGLGETSDAVLRQTDLPRKLAQNGILTIIPTSANIQANSQRCSFKA